MRAIVTVIGEIGPEQLGFCQFHEHLLICDGTSRQVNDALYMDNVELSALEAAALHQCGGDTVIDAQPGGCGRMAQELAQVSLMSGLNIICSTGFHKLVFYPPTHWIFQEEEARLTQFFLQELTLGVDNHCEEHMSGEIALQRAGIIKCALDRENLTPRYRVLFAAAAKAALEADRIMMVHIEQDSDPLELLEYLTGLGLAPDRLVFCHLDRAVPDLRVHRKLMEQGVYLEFDTIGRYKYHSDEEEIQIIRSHIQDGFVQRLLFSLDTTRLRLAAYTPGAVGLDYIRRVFLGKMLRAGIHEEEIDLISRVNPRRALTGE